MNNDIQLDGICSFDFDGVVSIGINPGPNDIIITGRPITEAEYVFNELRARGIHNQVFFQYCTKEQQTRESSGDHKATTIARLRKSGLRIVKHFEDDPIQSEIIKSRFEGSWIPFHVIEVNHNLTEK